MSLNYAGPHTHSFFYKCLYRFPSVIGNPWLQRADCMYRSMPLYTGDLRTHRFGYPRGVLEPISRGYRGTTKFYGSQKSYVDFPLHRGRCPNSMLFKGQLYTLIMIRTNHRKMSLPLSSYYSLPLLDWPGMTIFSCGHEAELTQDRSKVQ